MTSDCQPRTKNGQPHHSTTGVASTSCTQIAVREVSASMPAGDDMLGHRHDEQRHGERDADPEPPRHVAQLGVALVAGGRRHRLERHAADRAAARPLAHDLGVHRAGPQRASRRLCGGDARLVAGEALGFGDEPLAAAGAAEEILVAGMLGAVARGRRVDLMPQTGSVSSPAAAGSWP